MTLAVEKASSPREGPASCELWGSTTGGTEERDTPPHTHTHTHPQAT